MYAIHTPPRVLNAACVCRTSINTRLNVCKCLLMEQRILCAWLRGQEIFSSVIICRFLYSLFPLCSAHIRHANSVPLAIPGVRKSRPYSKGKALGVHGGELWTDKLQITKPYKHESNDVISQGWKQQIRLSRVYILHPSLFSIVWEGCAGAGHNIANTRTGCVWS